MQAVQHVILPPMQFPRDESLKLKSDRENLSGICNENTVSTSACDIIHLSGRNKLYDIFIQNTQRAFINVNDDFFFFFFRYLTAILTNYANSL